MMRRTTLAVATSLVILTVVPPARGGFIVPEQLSTERSLPPRVAVDEKGHAWVAWEQSPGSGCPDPAKSRVFLGDRPRGGQWRVRAATGFGATNPEISVGSSGRAVLTWLTGRTCSGFPNGQGSLYGAVVAPDGKLGEPHLLSSTFRAPAGARALAAADRDEALVVWEDTAGGGRIMNSRAGPDGRFSVPDPVGGVGARGAQIAMSSSGVAAIAWFLGGEPYTVQYAKRLPRGPFGPPITLASGLRDGFGPPTVAVDGLGDVLVAWTHGADFTMHTAGRTADGKELPPRPLMPGAGTVRAAGLTGFYATKQEMPFRAGGGATYSNGAATFTGYMTTSTDRGFNFGGVEQLPGGGEGGLAAAAIDRHGRALTVWRSREGQMLLASSRVPGGGWEPLGVLGENVANETFASNDDGGAVLAYLRNPGDTRVFASVGQITDHRDESAPKIAVESAQRRGRVIHARLRCDEPCTIRGRLRDGRRRVLATSAVISGSLGETRTIRLPLPDTVQTRTRGAPPRLEISATDGFGNNRRTLVRLRLRP